MRAFSIWLVLIQHGGINIPGLMPLKIGGIGVEIFFVLSGFLIGGIIFREIDKKNPRTIQREIPGGIISAKSALLFVIVNCLLFIATTFFINSIFASFSVFLVFYTPLF